MARSKEVVVVVDKLGGSVFRCSRYLSEHVNCDWKGKKNGGFLVDTLQVVRGLESHGLPSNHAEAITSSITNLLHHTLDNLSHSIVSRSDLEMSQMLIKSDLSKFKSQVQSSQDHHFSLLLLETEKIHNDVDKMRSELRNDIEKMRSELRYEIDKVTAGQRLDLNLEKGRTRDELANQSAETTTLSNKVDREVHALKAQLEGAKYDVVKYCIGSLVSISAVGLAVIRILL